MPAQPRDAKTKAPGAALVKSWVKEITAYEKAFKKWETRATKIIKRYRDDREKTGQTKMNILWSNVETIIPAVFARTPQPEVTRRHKDKDPVGRVAALMLERCLEYEIQQYDDYNNGVVNAVKDRFLPGRGVCWVRYEPHFTEGLPESQEGVAADGVQVTEDADNDQTEVIAYECAPVDYVHWQDFGHCLARTWEEVPAVWRRVYMTKEELTERFGKKVADGTPLDMRSMDTSDKELRAGEDRTKSKATVYEIWDRRSQKALWISKGREHPLDERDDPLNLQDFFPCPKPLFATLTSDDLVPVPDFAIYQDQADELDLICDRIDGLLRALKVVGVYDASQKALQRLLTEGTNNTMIPVDSWLTFGEKGGLKGSMDFLPIEMVAKALMDCYQARDQIKAQIYELTGISDIIRGQSQASETATAQEIKGRFASLRLKRMQEDVAKFCKDVLKIKAQIICKHFQPQTIVEMSGAEQMGEQPEVVMQALQLLKTDTMRNFRIEITADSLTQIDEEAEKQARVEFLTATGAFLEKAVMAGSQAPELKPLLGEMLMFGVRGFKVGRTIEGAFDTAMQQLSQPQPPREDPMVQVEREKLAAEQQRSAAELQQQQIKSQADIAIQQAESSARLQLEREKAMAEIAMAQEKARAEMAAREQELVIRERELALKAQQDARKLEMDHEMNMARTVAERERMSSELDMKREGQRTESELKRRGMETEAELKRESIQNEKKPDIEAIRPDITKANEAIEKAGETIKELREMLEGMSALVKAKKRVLRDEIGNPVAIEYEGVGKRKVESEDGEIVGVGELE